MYTLDANVFARDANPLDAEHSTCHRLVEQLEVVNRPVVLPLTVQVEAAGAVARSYRDPMRGRLYLDVLLSFTNITFVPVDATLAREAAYLAADYALRGMDAIYVAVARRRSCTLITLDDEVYRRAAAVVPVRKPAEVLADLSPTEP